jgi:hypothetical protein
MSESERIFIWPVEWMMNIILDAIELQKADIVYDGSETGVLHYTTELYGSIREFHLTITPAPRNRSRVRLEVLGAKPDREAHNVRMQFSLFESLMVGFVDTG